MFDKTLDAAGVLERASKAMGAQGLRSVRYMTTGAEYIFGQSASPGGPWPKYSFELMTTCCDYQSGSWSEELAGPRIRAEMRGGGEPSLPRGITYASDGHSWSQAGPKSFAAPWHAENRLHQVWITPHGVIKAAMRNRASLQWQSREGKALAALSFTEPGRFTATAFIDENFLVERVESSVPVTYCGMLPFVTSYCDYKDFGPVKFPARIRRSQGGFPVLDAVVKEVQPNVPDGIEVPQAVRQASAGQQAKTAVKVAEGVWEVPGSHNCVAIEMADHIIVVEAPLTEGMAGAVFQAVKREIPHKPIRYVINTHHHIDHAGGLRAVVAEGATIVTHALNKPLFQRYFAVPRTLAPDALAEAAKNAAFLTVDDRLAMTDGVRTVEIHHVRGNAHADDLIMVYLPGERLLIEADAFSPGAANAPPPGQPDAFAVNLQWNIERLALDIERIVPMHGPIVPLQEFHRALGRPA